MRILIVEDEPDLLDALKKQLQSSGYSVDGCEKNSCKAAVTALTAAATGLTPKII